MKRRRMKKVNSLYNESHTPSSMELGNEMQFESCFVGSPVIINEIDETQEKNKSNSDGILKIKVTKTRSYYDQDNEIEEWNAPIEESQLLLKH